MRKTPLVVFAGVIAILGLAVPLTITSGSGASASERAAQGRATDAIIGFGMSQGAQDRDNFVALHEAYEQAERVQLCMQDKGFTHDIAAAFPASAVLELSDMLTLKPTDVANTYLMSDARSSFGPETRESSMTIRSKSSLAAADTNSSETDSPWIRDQSQADTVAELWSQAMYGESLADMRHAAHANTPDEFAMRGCLGQSKGASVWTLRRELTPSRVSHMKAARETADTSAFQQCAARHGVLGATSMGAIEEAFADGNGKALDILTKCDDAWKEVTIEARNRAEAAFYAEHAALLDAQQRRYDGYLERVNDDHGFARYVLGVVKTSQRDGAAASD